MTQATPPLLVLDLGRRSYGEALALQRELAERRIQGSLSNDLLLLVEHDPVVTLGRGGRPESLPLSPTDLGRRGIEWYEVERGGDVTYHNPGQLVGYPILDLNQHRLDLHWYLRQLEAALISGLAELGIVAERHPPYTGVWVGGGDRKIASLGVHVRRWVTLHGFALNVSNDLSGFDLIVPCGIPGVRMTSIARELGSASWGDTRAAVVAAFGRTFDREPQAAQAEHLTELSAASRR